MMPILDGELSNARKARFDAVLQGSPRLLNGQIYLGFTFHAKSRTAPHSLGPGCG
jgi:hypothetical protein